MRFVRLCMIVSFLSFYLGLPNVSYGSDDHAINQMLMNSTDEAAVLFFDLSEGESTLIQMADQFTVLIGTGAVSSIQELLFRLDCLQIKKIDMLILPSLNEHYLGGLTNLLEELVISKLIVPKEGEQWIHEQYENLIEDVTSWGVGDQTKVHDELLFSVLESGHSVVPALNIDLKIGESTELFFANEASLVLEDLWIKHDLSQVNVLKVADFGRGTGTGEEFLESLDPEVAVIFNLQDHRASPGVLERLQETWIDTYETRQHGSILIKSDEEDYKVLTIRF